MSNETTLLPCPFCGSEAESFNPFDNTDGTWCVLCSECAAATGFEQTEAEAIEAWNTRAPEQAIAATLGGDVKDCENLLWGFIGALDVADTTDADKKPIISDYARQIAATLGGGECECVWNEQDGTFRCSSCDALLTNEISIEWPSHKVTPITLPNFCPKCGAKIVEAVER